MWLFYVCCFLIFQWIGEASCQQPESKTNWPFPFNTFIPLRQSKELHTLGHFDDYFTHLPQWKIVYGINCRFGYSLSVSTNWNVIWYLLGKENLFLFIWFCSAEFCHRAKKRVIKCTDTLHNTSERKTYFVFCAFKWNRPRLSPPPPPPLLPHNAHKHIYFATEYFCFGIYFSLWPAISLSSRCSPSQHIMHSRLQHFSLVSSVSVSFSLSICVWVFVRKWIYSLLPLNYMYYTQTFLWCFMDLLTLLVRSSGCFTAAFCHRFFCFGFCFYT